MPKTFRDVKISFFLALSSCYYFNLIPFITSIDTEASLLALAKSIYIILLDKLFYGVRGVAFR